MSEWKDQSRIPLGMSHFSRWYSPPGIPKFKHPADIDGILHTLDGNRFWMFEFKPVYPGDITTGQNITLTGFSQLPGCVSTVIFDPHAHDASGKLYPANLPLSGYKYLNGKRSRFNTTVALLNQSIADWFNNRDGFWSE